MDITIRQSRIEDLPQLVEINNDGTQEEKDIAQERLPAFIKAGNLIVAETNSTIAGLLYWKREFLDDKQWFLAQVTVAPEYQRKGIGERLWKEFLSIAQQAGVPYVFADISEGNIASKGLAEKMGGKVAGSLDLGSSDIRTFYRFDL